MKHYKVILTEAERIRAVEEGHKRQHWAVTHNCVTHFEDPDKNPRGCVAELGCCKLLGVRWCPVLGTDRERGDIVLPDMTIQVRAAKYPDYGMWHEVFSHDAQSRYYIFALADPDKVNVLVLGWCHGDRIPHLGKWKTMKDYPKMKSNSWAIPVQLLRDINEQFSVPVGGQLELF